jgi:gas vesicle protein
MDRDTFSKIGTFLGGVAIGSLVGILFAPASGRETRGKIKEGYQNLEDKTKEKMDELKETTKHQIERIKDAANDAIAKGEDVFHREKEKKS